MSDIQPLMGLPIAPRDLAGIDPLRYATIQPSIDASVRESYELKQYIARLSEQIDSTLASAN